MEPARRRADEPPPPATTVRGGTFAPLRRPMFRALWIAAVVSNVGTWMQEVGASWLMTSLTTSPLFVTLIQVAASTPMFVLAIPGGALADILDRRRLLLVTQTWMMLVAGVLGVLTIAGAVTPPVLIGMTAALGVGVALNGPAWQAIVSELVPREELPAAIALNGVGFNIARAVGPALGGLVVAAAGSGPVFLLNAASFLGTVFVLARWQRHVPAGPLPAERLVEAMRGGLRYVRYSPEFRAVITRAAGFVFFAIALIALLPLMARHELRTGPVGYGVLLGGLGFGAVTGAALLSRTRALFTRERLAQVGSLCFAAACVAVAHGGSFPLALVAMWIAGIWWLTLLSSFNAAAQGVVAGWVLARALSVYLLVFAAAMAAGSALWGALAGWVGTPWSLTAAAIGMVAALPILGRFALPPFEGRDVSPTKFAPAPNVDTSHDRGPVMVTVRYEIDPRDRVAFVTLMREMEYHRRRSGAVGWSLYEDPDDPDTMIEVFLVDSWLEHLRQHERATSADAALRARVFALHRGPTPPQVSHLLAVE